MREGITDICQIITNFVISIFITDFGDALAYIGDAILMR
jgi:hypothetical protein